MGKHKYVNKFEDVKTVKKEKKSNKFIFIGISVLLFAVIGFFVFKGLGTPDSENKTITSNQKSSSENLVINKSDITSTPKFYPYKAGGTNLEVFAIKASDGSIRTAFNTCQVCYSSGKGYYKFQNNVLVCQNCGNRFRPDQVEVEKGGCNPVPISKDDGKTESETEIVIPQSFLEQSSRLFKSWKTNA